MAWPARIKHLSSRIGRLYFSWLWASRWFAAVRGCINPYQVLASPQGITVNIPVTGIEREELESYRLRFQKYWDGKLEIEQEKVLREKEEMKKETILAKTMKPGPHMHDP